MSLNSDFVGLLISPIAGSFKKGTAYPIREGVVLTAAHVIPDIDSYNGQEEKRSYIRWPKFAGKKIITEVLYHCNNADVAVLACETPPDLEAVILCKDVPESKECWDSFGYAKSSTDRDSQQHKPESAAGQYLLKPNNDEVQQLRTTEYVTDETFWKGMSGAPVFTAGTPLLTGIFIESSLCYEDETGAQQAIFKGRLRAASIAHLLGRPAFAKAVYGDSYSEYQQEYEQKLRDYLRQHETLAAKLGSCDAILAELKQSPLQCIRKLKHDCQPFRDAQNRPVIQGFFHLLLSQVDVPYTWQGRHLHELDVSTRLLAELAVAKAYGVEPQFKESEQLIGRCVLPVSQTELGFETKASAKEQANAVAYAVYKHKNWGNEGLSQGVLLKNPQSYTGVNEELVLQREDEKAVWRFEINVKELEGQDQDHALMDKAVREYIHTHLLPDLPIVLYDRSSISAFRDEEKLQTHVRSFIKQIIMA